MIEACSQCTELYGSVHCGVASEAVPAPKRAHPFTDETPRRGAHTRFRMRGQDMTKPRSPGCNGCGAVPVTDPCKVCGARN